MTIFPAASDKGPPAPAPEIIVLRGLNLFYGDFQALKDIDVTFVLLFFQSFFLLIIV